jgi:hypothetical protein
MSRWGKLLIVSLPLALALTAGLRFIQHTDREYTFWLAAFGEITTQLEARCAASRSPEVCARASGRKAFADGLKAHHDAVMAWWWPVVVPMSIAWATTAIALVGVLRTRRRRLARGASHGNPEI